MIALVGGTAINIHCYLNAAAAMLLGFDYFDIWYAASLDRFGKYDSYAAINFYCYLNVWIALMHATLIGFD